MLIARWQRVYIEYPTAERNGPATNRQTASVPEERLWSRPLQSPEIQSVVLSVPSRTPVPADTRNLTGPPAYGLTARSSSSNRAPGAAERFPRPTPDRRPPPSGGRSWRSGDWRPGRREARLPSDTPAIQPDISRCDHAGKDSADSIDFPLDLWWGEVVARFLRSELFQR